ncbi:MAG: Swt1 family HEPN domain-containing protein [Chloroflexi bacterium]|nr:Swt1 family HEPN domain-containing protein [Chloroflexota bacterium]
MAITNHERVGKALDLLRQGLAPYIEREMRAAYESQWRKQAAYSLKREGDLPDDEQLDTHTLLVIMWDHWNEAFKGTLGFAERSLVSELRETRNRWAHQGTFSTDDTYRALDSIARLLAAVSAPEATDVERQKQELLRLRFEEEARRESRKAAVAPVEGRPSAGLRPWREIVTPHPDVASGRYLQAEFAADLWQVYMGEGTDEYRDPVQFFERTFLTDGLRRLLVGALRRLAGQPADPVIELQTNFGGGKTHSMLALYHLFSGTALSKLPGVESMLRDHGVQESAIRNPQSAICNRAVLVGTKISPGQPSRKPDGTLVHTLWGELAWQLGGAEGYAVVAEDDHRATNPGDALRVLFNRYAPCLILVDEWVAYARQLHDRADASARLSTSLPGGSFDTHFTFAQTLTEAAKAADRTLLVVSMPASDIEVGGDRGRTALDRLKNAIGRVESPWRPASAEEGFEIVRRRLFQPMSDPAAFAARDAVVDAFARLYREQGQEFPPECREAAYERRMTAAYPIHPELFDRLYTEWSSLDEFQRTRGVLRLMAAVIHALWERGDGNLLILPATVPIDDASVQAELTRYLEDHWVPVIEKDVDGPNSLPLALDRSNPNLGRYSACRRVARTVYMGSAPTAKTRNPGIDDRNVKLGCVQPGETPATFGDALRRLADGAAHLYVDRSRYWFSTQPSVNRLAQDRAARIDEDTVHEEIVRRLREDRARSDFSAVHLAPLSTADVPDEPSARLVVLHPKHPHVFKAADSPARQQAAAMLAGRGAGPRLYQNMLVFLAPEKARLAELVDAVRGYLAWKSIHDEREALDLGAFQRSQAETKVKLADDTARARIGETYALVLTPTQPDPRQPELTWEDLRLQGPDSLAVRAGRKLKNDGQLIVQYSAASLKLEIDRYNLWGEGDHISLKQVWEYFARYPYLPRLLDANTLLGAVQDGIGQVTWTENFAYAEGYDAERQRYLNLKAGVSGSVVMDSRSVLVKPAVALTQLRQDEEAATAHLRRGQPEGGEQPPRGGLVEPGQADRPGTGGGVPSPIERRLRRFYGTVEIDPLRAGRDVGQITEAVIQHLAGQVGARVKVTLEIEAELPDGAPENVVRTVSENARTLRFTNAAFEER